MAVPQKAIWTVSHILPTRKAILWKSGRRKSWPNWRMLSELANTSGRRRISTGPKLTISMAAMPPHSRMSNTR